MKLRTFTASDMPGAMAQVREALGDDAVILSTSNKGGRVTITAAIEPEHIQPVARPAPKPQPISLPDDSLVEQLASTLRFHNVPEQLAGRLAYKARHMDLDKLAALQKLSPSAGDSFQQQIMAKLLTHCYRFAPIPINRGNTRIMIIGAPGVGKTLSVAKLATQLVMEKMPVTVATTDTRRAGGIKQLAAFTDILQLQLKVLRSPDELSALAASVPANEALLVDTGGCNPYEEQEMNDTAEWIAAADIEPVLAMAAGIDSMEAVDMVRLFAFPRIERLLVTRLDTTRRLGSVLAAAEASKLALANFSDSARVVSEIKPMGAQDLAQRLQQAMN